MKILTLNAGSSSVRFASFEREGANLVQTVCRHDGVDSDGGELTADETRSIASAW